MMGLVLTLLYLIGGLGAVVWFVVSHKDEEEVSVDERYWMTSSMDVVGDSLRLPQSSVEEREGRRDPASL